jgi:protein phosphatase
LTLELALATGISGTSLGLYAVADGMGGLQAGEAASDLTLRVLAYSIIRSILLPEAKKEIPGVAEQFILAVVNGVIQAANRVVYEKGQSEGLYMGATLTGALIINNKAYIFNVGDSRAYVLEGEHLRQITADHSIVAELAAAGKITREEIYTHPQRNIITRCVGTESGVEPDLFIERMKPGTSLIICSDGLWEMVRDDEIGDVVLKADNPQAACEQLVRRANENGGVDNISVVVIRVK